MFVSIWKCLRTDASDFHLKQAGFLMQNIQRRNFNGICSSGLFLGALQAAVASCAVSLRSAFAFAGLPRRCDSMMACCS